MQITTEQYDKLMSPLNSTRVAKRSQGGKQLSYLEAWDVKAHLIRMFGFGNFDSEVLEYHNIGVQNYGTNERPMVEVMWSARVRLTVRTYDDLHAEHVTSYTECAVGSATGGRDGAGLGDLHDNALKSAASDALKRCAINLGTQFGLSLYDDGATRDVVKGTLVKPEGWKPKDVTAEQAAALAAAVGKKEEAKSE